MLRYFRHVMVFLAALGCCRAYGQLDATISLVTSPAGAGRLQYEYLIQNSPSSDVRINAFVLDVGTGADIKDLAGPPDWGADFDPLEDPFELVFLSTTAAAEIPAGGSGIFRFTSPLDPAPLSYFIANLLPDGNELGSVFGRVGSPAIGRAGLAGDYNGNGQVEQGDLDLVLLNWGDPFNAIGPRWVNERPTEGIVDQAELDSVLLDWGNVAAQGGAAGVPEPTTWVLLLMLLSTCVCLTRR